MNARKLISDYVFESDDMDSGSKFDREGFDRHRQRKSNSGPKANLPDYILERLEQLVRCIAFLLKDRELTEIHNSTTKIPSKIRGSFNYGNLRYELIDYVAIVSKKLRISKDLIYVAISKVATDRNWPTLETVHEGEYEGLSFEDALLALGGEKDRWAKLIPDTSGNIWWEFGRLEREYGI